MGYEVDVYCMGRAWDECEPHLIQAYLLAAAKSLQGCDKIHLTHWESPPRTRNIIVYPGFELPGGKYVARTKALLKLAKVESLRLVFTMFDVELCKVYNDFIRDNMIPVALMTSFTRPWRNWTAPWIFHQYNGFYPTHWIRQSETKQPPFEVGYVGWPKSKRHKVIKKLGYTPLVYIGHNADKQPDFRAIMCGQYTPYVYLKELYDKAGWHLLVSDDELNNVQPTIARMGEAWACGKPCIFTEKMRLSRKTIYSPKTVDPALPHWKHPSFLDPFPWDLVKEWWGDTPAEIFDISRRGLRDGQYDLNELAEVARRQQQLIGHHYYSMNPMVEKLEKWFMGGSEFDESQRNGRLFDPRSPVIRYLLSD